jgi:hypothetical protein
MPALNRRMTGPNRVADAVIDRQSGRYTLRKQGNKGELCIQREENSYRSEKMESAYESLLG